LRMGAEVYQALKKVLKDKGLNTNVGDEGGFAPSLPPIKPPSKRLSRPSKKPVTNPVKIASSPSTLLPANSMRTAAMCWPAKAFLSPAQEMVDFYVKWVNDYPIVSIEDGMAEDDWDGWQLMTKKLGEKIHLIGDDLYVTNVNRLSQGIKTKPPTPFSSN
jgi:enolase